MQYTIGGAVLKAMARWVWDPATRWTILFCLALVMLTAPVAVHAGEPTKHFDIKAQPLSDALMAFGAQTGAIVMAASELTTGKISRPVIGELTLRQALTRMLHGTGLRFVTIANGTILIVRDPPRS